MSNVIPFRPRTPRIETIRQTRRTPRKRPLEEPDYGEDGLAELLERSIRAVVSDPVRRQ